MRRVLLWQMVVVYLVDERVQVVVVGVVVGVVVIAVDDYAVK